MQKESERYQLDIKRIYSNKRMVVESQTPFENAVRCTEKKDAKRSRIRNVSKGMIKLCA